MSSNTNNSNKYVAKGGSTGNRDGNRGGNRGTNNGGNRGPNNGGNRGGNRGGNGGYGGARTYNNETRYTSIDQIKMAWRRDLIANPGASSDEFIKNKSVQAFLKADSTALGEILSYMKNSRNEFAHHSRECLKTARMWESQGLYPWADQWKKYARNPDGEYPKCLHEDLKKGMFTYVDRNTGVETVNFRGYDAILNRGSGRYGREPFSGSGASKVLERIEEPSNAQLGEIREEDPRKRDGKTHPMRLIAKLKELQKKYPDVYKKDENYVVAH